MAFQLFTPLFDKFDTVTNQFVTETSSKLVATLTPVITVGLTLGFLLFALGIVRGVIETPISELIYRVFKIGIIVSIATAGGLYQTDIADAIISTPDALAIALVNGDGVESSAGAILDSTAVYAFDVAAEKWEKATFWSGEGFMHIIYSALIIVSASLLLAIGGAFLIMAKVGIAILVALGPMFIFMLLWQPTHRYFESWLGQVVNYGLLVVLVSILFLFLMGIYGGYMSQVSDGGSGVAESFNAIYSLAGALIISFISIIILLQMPSMAAALSQGVGLSYLWEAKLATKGAGKAGRAGGKAAAKGAKGVYSAVRHPVQTARAAGSSIKGMASRVSGFAFGSGKK